MEMVVLSTKRNTARCRIVGDDSVLIFRSIYVWDLIPGEIATVKPGKKWLYGRLHYISGEVESARIDVKALGLVPLKLKGSLASGTRKESIGEKRTSRSRIGRSRS
jgi:hypothetical protein